VEKVKASRNVRSGKGKMRNRRYVQRKGPLVVYATDSGITKVGAAPTVRS
jgi:large subunit ribosomal protein L4e